MDRGSNIPTQREQSWTLVARLPDTSGTSREPGTSLQGPEVQQPPRRPSAIGNHHVTAACLGVPAPPHSMQNTNGPLTPGVQQPHMSGKILNANRGWKEKPAAVFQTRQTDATNKNQRKKKKKSVPWESSFKKTVDGTSAAPDKKIPSCCRSPA